MAIRDAIKLHRKATILKRLIIAILLGTSSTCLAQQGAVDAIMNDFEDNAKSEIKAFCADKWPSDFVMQKHCIAESVKDRDEAQHLDVMANKNNMIIWGTCLGRWKDDAGRTDWTMANHCIQEQLKALAEIQ